MVLKRKPKQKPIRKIRGGGSNTNTNTNTNDNNDNNVLSKAGDFNQDIYIYIKELTSTEGEIDTEFKWIPKNKPVDASRDVIIFYVYIPKDWPKENRSDFAAFQVLYYFTVLQKFIHDVNKKEDWLKEYTVTESAVQWTNAIKKAQNDIDEHYKMMKKYKTSMTYNYVNASETVRDVSLDAVAVAASEKKIQQSLSA